jgi:hypothetical protein
MEHSPLVGQAAVVPEAATGVTVGLSLAGLAGDKAHKVDLAQQRTDWDQECHMGRRMG